jgi:hypothetical protein
MRKRIEFNADSADLRTKVICLNEDGTISGTVVGVFDDKFPEHPRMILVSPEFDESYKKFNFQTEIFEDISRPVKPVYTPRELALAIRSNDTEKLEAFASNELDK